MTAETAAKPVPHGLSVFEERIYGHLVDHVSSEADLVASYRDLAEAPATPEAARYLLRLIVEDEQRHHRIIGEIATALGEGIAWRANGDTVPNLSHDKPNPDLEAVTKGFLAAERADRKELSALPRSCGSSVTRRCGRCSSRSWNLTPRSTSAFSASSATTWPGVQTEGT